MSACCLPREIVVEILQRLPPKTLIKCTSVCKSWRSLITHPSFISDNLRRPINHFLLLQWHNEENLPNPNPSPTLIQCSLRHDDDPLTEFSTLDLPRSSEHEYFVVGICNGLVCITSSPDHLTLIICNPCIRRYVSLPEPFDLPGIYTACVGLGFDSKTNDYKVVRLACLTDDECFGLCEPEVEVYSLATGFWKSITAVPPVCSLCCVGTYYSPHAFVDGIIHWGAQRWEDDSHWYCFILSFDFEDEVFDEIMLPQNIAHNSCTNSIIVVGGGKCLTVYHLGSSPSSYSIWVMKEYGVVESWNKLFNLDWLGFYLEAPLFGIRLPNVTRLPMAIFCRNSTEVLLLVVKAGNEQLYLLDADRKRFEDLKIGEGCAWWYLYSGYYSESLVLLNKASDLVSY